jgi:hypothetical protein
VRVEPPARAPAVRWSSGRIHWSDGSPHLFTWG